MSDHHHRLPRRVRNELRFRQLTVASKTRIADTFWRIVFTGSDLAGFTSQGFDDHVKVFFPDAATGELALPEVTDEGVVWKEGVRPVSRDYTPLFFDAEQQTLTLDFYIHDGGVASGWAEQAQVGDPLAIGGPRGSLVVPEDYAFQLYITDESGLPAVKRRNLTQTAHISQLYAFADPAQGAAYLDVHNDLHVSWLGSGHMQGKHLDTLLDTLDTVTLPAENYFIWLTGEGEAVKKLSEYFIEQRGCDERFVRAVAYWHNK